MRLFRPTLLAVAILCAAAPARADITGFIGTNTTPENRGVKGVALGGGLLFVAFEFEYAATSSDASVNAPSLNTGMGNMLFQTPTMIHGFQPYFTIGGGLYRERLGTRTETGFAPNSGFGVKVALAGPLRLRVDYRAFSLGRGALYSPAHRIYAGLNLKL